jgi:hypothetical protein
LWAIGLVGSFAAPPAWAVLEEFAQFLTLAGLLTAVAIAVLKYRLYDVDLVINRTLVYGSLAVLITAVYVALVVGAGALVGTRDEPNLGMSVLATAIVAVAFQPARERVQRLANQLVYGHRLSPYEVLSEFSRRMAGALSVDDVLPHLLGDAHPRSIRMVTPWPIWHRRGMLSGPVNGRGPADWTFDCQR